ncbi:MAG: hypothetical protein WCP39_05890 [Chlamydiota bacterium]
MSLSISINFIPNLLTAIETKQSLTPFRQIIKQIKPNQLSAQQLLIYRTASEILAAHKPRIIPIIKKITFSLLAGTIGYLGHRYIGIPRSLGILTIIGSTYVLIKLRHTKDAPKRTPVPIPEPIPTPRAPSPTQCPLSNEIIPPGEEITVDGQTMNIHYFVLSSLSLNSKEPQNPLNRNPLDEKTLNTIADFYKINLLDFLDLFSTNGSASQLTTQKETQALQRIHNQHLPEQDEIHQVGQIQLEHDDLLRDSRKAALFNLVLPLLDSEPAKYNALLQIINPT